MLHQDYIPFNTLAEEKVSYKSKTCKTPQEVKAAFCIGRKPTLDSMVCIGHRSVR